MTPDEAVKDGPDRTPVTTVAELEAMDQQEILEGYKDGYGGEPEPGDNRSKAYWHGWHNARRDREHGPPDATSIALVKDMRRHGFGPFANPDQPQ